MEISHLHKSCVHTKKKPNPKTKTTKKPKPKQNTAVSLFKVEIVAIQAQMKFSHTIMGLFYSFLHRENN